jgi:hypothetical protein
MTELTPELDGARPLGDMPLAGEAASLLVRAVAFTILRPLPQAAVQIAALPLVAPDVLVDGLMADPQQTVAGEEAADLLGAEIRTKQSFDRSPVTSGEVTVAARS